MRLKEIENYLSKQEDKIISEELSIKSLIFKILDFVEKICNFEKNPSQIHKILHIYKYKSLYK